MKVKQGRVLRGYKSIMCGALALGLAACSMPVKLPSLGGPAPDQPQDISCESLSAEKARLLAERDDLKSPLRFSSMTEAQRDAELTQLNGKLYTVAKVQFDKQCPAVANGSAGSVVR
jgi:hypothetical protein